MSLEPNQLGRRSFEAWPAQNNNKGTSRERKAAPSFPKISGNGSQSAGSGNRIVPQHFNSVASIMMRLWSPILSAGSGSGSAVRTENNGQEPNYVSAIWCRGSSRLTGNCEKSTRSRGRTVGKPDILQDWILCTAD